MNCVGPGHVGDNLNGITHLLSILVTHIHHSGLLVDVGVGRAVQEST